MNLVMQRDMMMKLKSMKIEKVKDGYILSRFIGKEIKQFKITFEEAYELSARYDYDFDA